MDFCEFKARLVYRDNSRIARATQRNPVSKQTSKQTKKRKDERKKENWTGEMSPWIKLFAAQT